MIPLLALCLCLADAPPSPSPVGPPPASWGVDPFYAKGVAVDGLPIVASARVSDYAVREAAYLVDHMLATRVDLRAALVRSKARVAIMATTERTTDLPEHRTMQPAAYWNRRARGLGGRTTSCGEENLLNIPGDPYDAENILIHEFAHCIHDQALARVDPDFNRKLKAAYDEALARGLWKDTYAATSTHEYWAEGVQSYFDTNRHDDAVHNHVDTREELQAYDPGLYALVLAAFPANDWRYVRPDRRPEPGHLLGLDRAAIPRFAWKPEEVDAAKVPPERTRRRPAGPAKPEATR